MDKAEFEKAFNHFHFRLSKQILSNHNNKNVVWSPFLWHLTLTKLYLCSSEKTSQELSTILDYDAKLSKRDPARNVRNILTSLVQDRYTYFSEKMMIDQNFTLCDDTNQRLEKYFGTGNGIYTVNFVKQEKTTRKINALVEADTNHGVQSFVKDEFAAGSCAVLTQVMFFKGQWEKGFKREDVRMHPFWINDKETCQVEMMFGRNEFKYARIKEWKVTAVEMYFHKSEMSFVILLPDSKTGLGNLEGKLCGKGHEKVFTKLDESLVNKGVNIAIPKLVLEMEYSDMDKHLKKIGAASLFDPKKCTLGDAISDTQGLPFCISKVIHKSILKLKTQGKDVPANPMLFDMNTPQFMVDHPFMFFLRLKKTPFVLLSGSIRRIEVPTPVNDAPPQQFGSPSMPPPMMGPGPYSMPLMRHPMNPPPLTPPMAMRFPMQQQHMNGPYMRMPPF